MSRGTDTIDTVSEAGSIDATIIVSVRYVLRPTPESTPSSSRFTRGAAGVAVGVGDALALADGLAGIRKLGSGSALSRGPAKAVGEASVKIWSAVSRATSVAKPA